VNRQSPHGLDRKRVQQLHRVAESAARPAVRIDRISEKLIGEPYRVNPMIGSAGSAEIFTAAMEGFDCVTYIETVLALAQSNDAPRFADTLRRIRYADGRIDWRRRNHYMSEWIRNNIRTGSVRRVPGLKASVEKQRTLNIVPGLPARRARFSCVPKASLLRQAKRLQTGDLIFFASTRPHLDVFHCGIVVNNGNGLRLRHASRSRGGVVEQELAEFLKQNRMAGVMVVRPVEAD
jgi:cell wall-associated NlpC family hydrolase